jgi:hypothetical protein
MTARTLVTASVVVLGTLAVFALGQPDPAPPSSPSPESPARPSPTPAPADSDLAAIRDVFRFGDEPTAPTRPPETTVGAAPAGAEAPPTSVSGPRLVGLVRREGGLLAAIAVEGEILLLGPGDSELGYTVVDVSEERVVIRDGAGAETVLPLGAS